MWYSRSRKKDILLWKCEKAMTGSMPSVTDPLKLEQGDQDF